MPYGPAGITTSGGLARDLTGEPDCRVPPALLPEAETRHEKAHALWRSTVPVSTDVDSENRTFRKPQSRCRENTE
jgi:hypothetical protein